MSRSSLTIVTSLIALVVTSAVGCQSGTKSNTPPPTTPISADALEQIRSDFAQTDPNVKLGSVAEVLPAGDGDNLRVTGVSGEDFPVGATVSVIDANSDVLAHGTVYATVDGNADVRFVPVSGKRRPAAGDAVVKFTRG